MDSHTALPGRGGPPNRDARQAGLERRGPRHGGLDCHGSIELDGVGIAWQCRSAGPSCRVRVVYGGQLYVEVELTPAREIVPFSAYREDGSFLFSGSIRLDPARPALVLERLRTPGNADIVDRVLCPPGPPVPPDPPPPEPIEDPPAPIEGEALVASAEDLFPYIYLRPWPAASDEERRRRFVAYRPIEPAPDPYLYGQLADQHRQHDARAMRDTAIAFLEGKPPWSGQAIRHLGELGTPLDRLAELEARLRRECRRGPIEDRAMVERVERALGLSWPRLVHELRSTAWRRQVERAWQTIFALLVELGDALDLLENLSRTVILERLLQRLAERLGPHLDQAGGVEPETLDDDGPLDDERLPEGTPTVVEKSSLEKVDPRCGPCLEIEASLLLPSALFPLPPQASKPEPASDSAARSGADAGHRAGLRPYAIGDLQLVRRRLLRYTLGEVSRIENVMRGEQKETQLRDRRVETHSNEQATTRREGSEQRSTAHELDFASTVEARLRAELDLEFSTQYGPPTEAKAVGFLRTGKDGETPARIEGQAAASELGRSITRAAGRALARDVWRRRAHVSLAEHEETAIHRLDGRGADQHQRGIYRWVHQVYENWVENTGRRLLLEIFLPDPARAFRAAEADLDGRDLAPPVSPSELGLDGFLDLSLEPESPLFWATLAARYGAEEVEPPPTAERTASASLASDGLPSPLAPSTTWIEQADGYVARRASLALVAPSPDLAVDGTVGQVPFGPLGPGKSTTVDLHDENDSVAVSAVARSETSSAPESLPGSSEPPPPTTTTTPPTTIAGPSTPAPAPSDGPTGWALTAEIRSVPGPDLLARWRLATYRALVAGYERQRAAYLERAGARRGQRETVDSLEARETVRRALGDDVRRLLWQQAARDQGSALEAKWSEPRYFGLFDRAFEWRAMAYRTTVRSTPAGAGELHLAGDAPEWTSFLQASWARVLLPVRPEHERAVAFFLASGRWWPGLDSLAPTHEASLDLVTELMSRAEGSEAERPAADVAGAERGLDAAASAQGHGHPDSWTVEIPTAMVVLQESSELPTFHPASAWAQTEPQAHPPRSSRDRAPSSDGSPTADGAHRPTPRTEKETQS